MEKEIDVSLLQHLQVYPLRKSVQHGTTQVDDRASEGLKECFPCDEIALEGFCPSLFRGILYPTFASASNSLSTAINYFSLLEAQGCVPWDISYPC